MDGTAQFIVALLGAVSTLFGLVTTLALYIWRQQAKELRECQATLEEYEQPAKDATRALLQGVRPGGRRDTDPPDTQPWPWSESSRPHQPRKPRRP